MSRKLSLEEIAERKILVPGQDYLRDYLAKAPDPIGIYEHSHPTSTCPEKLTLLQEESGREWDLKQTIRAVYFKHGHHIHCGITPETGRLVNTTAFFGRMLPQATQLPEYVEQGTCTPFVPIWDMSCAAGRIQHFYVHHKPEFDDMLSDFSIGGTGSEAHKRSLWLPYGDAVRLLQEQFEDLVSVGDMYPGRRSKSYKRGDEVEAHAR